MPALLLVGRLRILALTPAPETTPAKTAAAETTAPRSRRISIRTLRVGARRRIAAFRSLSTPPESLAPCSGLLRCAGQSRVRLQFQIESQRSGRRRDLTWRRVEAKHRYRETAGRTRQAAHSKAACVVRYGGDFVGTARRGHGGSGDWLATRGDRSALGFP